MKSYTYAISPSVSSRMTDIWLICQLAYGGAVGSTQEMTVFDWLWWMMWYIYWALWMYCTCLRVPVVLYVCACIVRICVTVCVSFLACMHMFLRVCVCVCVCTRIQHRELRKNHPLPTFIWCHNSILAEHNYALKARLLLWWVSEWRSFRKLKANGSAFITPNSAKCPVLNHMRSGPSFSALHAI